MGFMLGVMLLYAFLFEHLGYAISTFLAFMAGVSTWTAGTWCAMPSSR